MACKHHIIKILEKARGPLTLYEIQLKIAGRFREVHETTAISARIRGDVRPIVRANGMDVFSKRAAGKCAHVYWLAKAQKPKGIIKA